MRDGTRGAATIVTLALVAAAVASACSKKDATAPQATGPQITGCNSVRYNGTTFNNIGCAPGIASFDVDISQNGVSARFHITCSGGCVSSAVAF